MRPYPVEKRQRPQQKLRMILPEWVSLHAVVRVEIAVRDQVPSLVIDSKVPGQGEAVILDRAPDEEPGQLQAQDGIADPPDEAQRAGWRRRWAWRGVRRRGDDHPAHEPNLTARIGE